MHGRRTKSSQPERPTALLLDSFHIGQAEPYLSTLPGWERRALLPEARRQEAVRLKAGFSHLPKYSTMTGERWAKWGDSYSPGILIDKRGRGADER